MLDRILTAARNAVGSRPARTFVQSFVAVYLAGNFESNLADVSVARKAAVAGLAAVASWFLSWAEGRGVVPNTRTD